MVNYKYITIKQGKLIRDASSSLSLSLFKYERYTEGHINVAGIIAQANTAFESRQFSSLYVFPSIFWLRFFTKFRITSGS